MDDIQLGNKKETDSLSIKEFFHKYIKYLPWIIFSVAIALLGAYLYLRYATRIYSASASMMISLSSNTKGSNDKVDELLFGSTQANNILNEIEILKSRSLMRRVVEKNNLGISYTGIGKIREVNIYKTAPFELIIKEITDSTNSFLLEFEVTSVNSFVLKNNKKQIQFGEDIKLSTATVAIVAKSAMSVGLEYRVQWAPTNVIANGFASKVVISPKITGTGILILQMQETNAELASDVLNALMAEYDVMKIDENNQMTNQTLKFIDERLNILTTELDTIQQKLLRYQVENDLINVENQYTAFFEKMNESTKLLEDVTGNVAMVELIQNYLKNNNLKYNRITVPSALGLTDITLNELVTSYNKLQFDRESLLNANIPTGNPAVKDIELQIEKARKSILENLINIKEVYTNSARRINTYNTNAHSEVKSMPYKVKQYVELKREVDIKLELLKQLQGKREEAAITRASTISNSKILELSNPNKNPISPERKIIQIIAILIGLSIPICIIFIKELLNDRVNTKSDITRHSNVPILGEVSRSNQDKVLVVSKTSRTMVAEQFRTIRSNLQFITGKVEKPTIMITSSFSGEGKSFISTNIGAVLALSGKKTVILEFDIRKPMLLAGLNIVKKPGIINYLVSKANLDDLILKVDEVDNLYVLPCGPIPPNPSELLLDGRLDTLFKELKERFDIIVIDTAPVGVVSDSLSLAKHADATLYIVRQGYTYKRQVKMIDEFYTGGKLPGMSVIVNDIKPQSGYGYYGYGGYGYTYGYVKNSYYDVEETNKGIGQKIKRLFKRKK